MKGSEQPRRCSRSAQQPSWASLHLAAVPMAPVPAGLSGGTGVHQDSAPGSRPSCWDAIGGALCQRTYHCGRDRAFDIWFTESVSWGFSPHSAGYCIACMFYGFFGGSSCCCLSSDCGNLFLTLSLLVALEARHTFC